MVNDTINTERFLFLKKSLCILEIMRLQHIVKINDEEVNYDELQKDIMNELSTVRDMFTIPANTLRKGVSVINLGEFRQELKKILSSRHDRKIQHRRIRKRDIYTYPNKTVAFTIMAQEFKARNKLWGDDIRHSVCGIVNDAEYMMNAVSAFVQYDDTDLNLSTIILFLNTLELIDWIFSLSEDGEGIFTHTPIPSELEVNDNA